MICWKISGADLMSNGRRSHLYLPIGVLKVVRYDDFSFSLIWRNPDLASRSKKTQAFGMFQTMSSTMSSFHNFVKVRLVQINANLIVSNGYNHRTDPFSWIFYFGNVTVLLHLLELSDNPWFQWCRLSTRCMILLPQHPELFLCCVPLAWYRKF